MLKWRVLVVMTVAAMMVSNLAAQNKANFSGTWTLVTDHKTPTSGGRRGGGGGVVSEVSGAAFNCGTECTIVQNARTLTITRPANPQGVKRPDVVLNLDGRESYIPQPTSPPTEFTAEAKWDGSKLVVTRSLGRLTITQTLALEAGELAVVNIFNVEDFAPVTLTYVKR